MGVWMDGWKDRWSRRSTEAMIPLSAQTGSSFFVRSSHPSVHLSSLLLPPSIQRQHHHQHNQLCHQCVCWLRDLLHPGLHGPPPERARVGGGRPRPGPGLRGLPRSPHAAAHLTAVVSALLLHAHPPGTWNSGQEPPEPPQRTSSHGRGSY